VRAVLRRAAFDWDWICKAPRVRMLPEPKRRIRWLTREEADRLIGALPEHLAAMARFSLETGLRRANVTGLLWSQVDLARRTAWVHADQAKARKAIVKRHPVLTPGRHLELTPWFKSTSPTPCPSIVTESIPTDAFPASDSCRRGS